MARRLFYLYRWLDSFLQNLGKLMYLRLNSGSLFPMIGWWDIRMIRIMATVTAQACTNIKYGRKS